MMLFQDRPSRFLPALFGAMVVFGAAALHAQDRTEISPLRNQLEQLLKAKKYAEALPVARRVTELAEQRHGRSHDTYKAAVAKLVQVLTAQRSERGAKPDAHEAAAVSCEELRALLQIGSQLSTLPKTEIKDTAEFLMSLTAASLFPMLPATVSGASSAAI